MAEFTDLGAAGFGPYLSGDTPLAVPFDASGAQRIQQQLVDALMQMDARQKQEAALNSPLVQEAMSSLMGPSMGGSLGMGMGGMGAMGAGPSPLAQGAMSDFGMMTGAMGIPPMAPGMFSNAPITQIPRAPVMAPVSSVLDPAGAPAPVAGPVDMGGVRVRVKGQAPRYVTGPEAYPGPETGPARQVPPAPQAQKPPAFRTMAPAQQVQALRQRMTPEQFDILKQLAPYLTQRASAQDAAAGREEVAKLRSQTDLEKARLGSSVQLVGIFARMRTQMELGAADFQSSAARLQAARSKGERDSTLEDMRKRAGQALQQYNFLQGQYTNSMAAGLASARPGSAEANLVQQLNEDLSAAANAYRTMQAQYDNAISGRYGSLVPAPVQTRSGGRDPSNTPPPTPGDSVPDFGRMSDKDLEARKAELLRKAGRK